MSDMFLTGAQAQKLAEKITSAIGELDGLMTKGPLRRADRALD